MIFNRFDNRVGPSDATTPIGRALRYAGPPAILGGALQVATQSFAAQLNHTAALGPSLHVPYPLYLPWSILRWASTLQPIHPELYDQAVGMGITAGAVGLLGLVALHAKLTPTGTYLHGSARWAQRRDLQRAGLLPNTPTLRHRIQQLREAPPQGPPAVIVGAWRDGQGQTRYLAHSGPEHVLAVAPTRSGKGVGLVVPTLLQWSGSAVVLDIKGELHALTSGWRYRHARQTILLLNFATLERTAHWNPLAEIRTGTVHEVGDVQNLALLLVDPDGKGVESDHWRSTAMALLVGVILHLLHRGDPNTGDPSYVPCLADVYAFLNDPTRPASELWHEMVASTIPASASEGAKMLNRPEEEAGSVLSTAQRCLSLFQDPVIAENTRCSDFRIHDLMHAARPVTLYLVPNPADKDRLLPLIRIFISMALRLLADHIEFEGGQPKPHYRHKLLLMLDEFVALRRLNILQEALGYVAGYGIKCYLICQDYQQLTSRDYGYGPDETITGNCHIQAVMRPDTLATAKAISEKVGVTTVKQTQVTRSGKGPFGSSSSTVQHIQRPLLTPDECMRLRGARTIGSEIVEGGEMLVFAAGMPAARGPQPLYFQDPVLSARARVAPPEPAHAPAPEPPADGHEA